MFDAAISVILIIFLITIILFFSSFFILFCLMGSLGVHQTVFINICSLTKIILDIKFLLGYSWIKQVFVNFD